MKAARYTYVFLLVLVFLVPATGFYYNKHFCLTSGEMHVVINGDYDCCSTQDPAEGEHSRACCAADPGEEPYAPVSCSLEESTETCCLNENGYIKSDEDYTSPGKTVMPQAKVLTVATLPNADAPLSDPDGVETTTKPPPFTTSSAGILYRYSILLI